MWTWITRRLGPNLWQATRQWNEDDGQMLAASLAYYSVLSLFPLLIVLIAALGFVLRFSDEAQRAQQRLLHVIADSTSRDLAQQIESLLREVQSGASINGPVGLATLIFGAIGIFAHFDVAFDRIWKEKSTTAGESKLLHAVYDTVHGKFRAFLMLLGIGLIVLAAFIVSMVISGLRHYAVDLPFGRHLWRSVQTATGSAVNVVFFTAVYKALSRRRVLWREAAGGGLLAGVAWEVGRLALAAFVIGNNYSAYGLVGAFIALLLWIFYGSCLLFFGAEFVQVIAKQREDRCATGANIAPPSVASPS